MEGEDRDHGWTDRLVLVATSYRRVGLGRLGAFVLPADDVAARQGLRAALGADELVYLATCNRVECYALLAREATAAALEEAGAGARAFFAARGASLAPGPAAAGGLEPLLVLGGADAARHLLRVASGLDSLVLGETEIAGQARRAVEHARAAGLAGPGLARLFEAAQACGRRVRAETGLARASVSAATIAAQKVKKHFGAAGPGVTVFVGTGEMTRKVARALDGTPGERLFVNRTLAKAEELARRHGGRALSLEAFVAAPPPWVDLVFAATGATEPVVPAAALRPALEARRRAGAGRPLIVVDLGLPRDVDPALDAEEGVVVCSMEHVGHAARAAEAAAADALAAAEAVVAAEVERLVREDRFRTLAGASARAILDERLAHLSPTDREVILRFATGLAARMARQPASLAG